MKTIFEQYIEALDALKAPGVPVDKTAIFVNDGLGNLTAYTDAGSYKGEDIDNYINFSVLPWAFLYGVGCSGMNHANFFHGHEYQPASVIALKKEDDYYLNVDILNYANACMAESHERFRNPEKNTITMVSYSGESDYTYVEEFKDVEAFTKFASELINCLDEDYFKEEE